MSTRQNRITTMNRESMTLIEWICAAGVAIEPRAFKTEWRTTPRRETWRPGTDDATRVYRGSTYRDPYEDGLRRNDVRKEHLKAWDAGEDPTEWRAFYQKAA